MYKKSKDFVGHSAAVYSMDFDGAFIYSASGDKYVTRWDISSGKQDAFAIQFTKSPFSISLFSGNSYLAVGLENGDLHFFNLTERKEEKFFKQHKSGIFSILENPLNNQLYTTDVDGNLVVWNTKSFELELILPFGCGKIRRMSLNKDKSKLVLSCQDGEIRILDTSFFNLLHSFKAHQGGVTSLIYSKDEKLLISGGKDALLKVWDLNHFTCIKELPIHKFSIYDLLLLNENEFISCSRDSTIKVWDAKTFQPIQRFENRSEGHKHSVNQLLKIGECSFASCSDDKKIMLFDK